MKHWMLYLSLVLLVATGLSACGGPGTREDSLRVRLYNYSAAVRWNEIEQAAGFVDPETQRARPFTAADLERWRQVQVSRYVEGPQGMDAQGRVLIAVEIELIDRATQSVRSIIDRQRWRYDEQAKTWWLESGLPSLDAPTR